MRIVCIQHAPFEDAGVIAPWAAAHEHRFEVVRLYEGQGLPSVSDVDWAVVMGGPMSVNDEAHFPWLRTEKDWMRRVIEQGGGLLGICLGAQMIAQVLGARVFPNACKEIGWFPENCPGDLDTGPFVQDSAAMTSNARAFDNAHMAMHTLLDGMARTTQEKEGGRR